MGGNLGLGLGELKGLESCYYDDKRSGSSTSSRSGSSSPTLSILQMSKRSTGALRTKYLSLALVVLLSLYLLVAPHPFHTLAPHPSLIHGKSVHGYNTTFPAFLDAHFARPPRPSADPTIPTRADTSPHIWLTQSDERWIHTGTATLALFVQRLNKERQARYGGRGELLRETALVVLCLDQICVERCKSLEGMYCYGGYKYSRPAQMPVASWPKIGGLLDALEFRDTFFVDSDVAFREDPYPTMEPLMEKYDLISSESEAHQHFNTGFFWLKSSPVAIARWSEYALSLRTSAPLFSNAPVLAFSSSSDDSLLPAHLHPNSHSGASGSWSVPEVAQSDLEEGTGTDGLKVKVLDGRVFRNYQPEEAILGGTGMSSSAANSIYLHTGCGDDVMSKNYIAQSLGYWQNLNGYYERPPNILMVDEMTGTQEEVLQMLKVLLVVAHYTGRSFQPPATTLLLDIASPSALENFTAQHRKIYATFPLPQIASAVGVDILASDFAENAARWLIGDSVLRDNDGRSKRSAVIDPLVVKGPVVKSLLEVVDFDIRGVPSIGALLLQMNLLPYSSTRVVRLTNLHNSNGRRLWRYYSLPPSVTALPLCASLDLAPKCGKICRWEIEDDKEVDVPGGPGVISGWMPKAEMMGPHLRMEARRKRVSAFRGKERLSELEDEEDRNI